MRSMQSISSASASAASLSLLLCKINHSSLVAREGRFLFHRPFSSDSAKLFAFVGPVCRPFSHLSPPVRFTAKQGQVWPVNLWWLKCLPVVSGKEHAEHQKFMERLNIVLFISREMERKRERRFRMCNRFILQIKGVIRWEGGTFSHTFLVGHARISRA